MSADVADALKRIEVPNVFVQQQALQRLISLAASQKASSNVPAREDSAATKGLWGLLSHTSPRIVSLACSGLYSLVRQGVVSWSSCVNGIADRIATAHCKCRGSVIDCLAKLVRDRALDTVTTVGSDGSREMTLSIADIFSLSPFHSSPSRKHPFVVAILACDDAWGAIAQHCDILLSTDEITSIVTTAPASRDGPLVPGDATQRRVAVFAAILPALRYFLLGGDNGIASSSACGLRATAERLLLRVCSDGDLPRDARAKAFDVVLAALRSSHFASVAASEWTVSLACTSWQWSHDYGDTSFRISLLDALLSLASEQRRPAFVGGDCNSLDARIIPLLSKCIRTCTPHLLSDADGSACTHSLAIRIPAHLSSHLAVAVGDEWSLLVDTIARFASAALLRAENSHNGAAVASLVLLQLRLCVFPLLQNIALTPNEQALAAIEAIESGTRQIHVMHTPPPHMPSSGCMRRLDSDSSVAAIVAELHAFAFASPSQGQRALDDCLEHISRAVARETKWRERSDPHSAVAVARTPVNATMPIPLILSFAASVLLYGEPSSCDAAVRTIGRMLACFENIALSVVPLVLRAVSSLSVTKLGASSGDTSGMAALDLLPLLATDRICASNAVRIISTMHAVPSLAPVALSLMLRAWDIQDRVFPHLEAIVCSTTYAPSRHRKRSDTSMSSFEWEVVRAECMRSVCSRKPAAGVGMIPHAALLIETYLDEVIRDEGIHARLAASAVAFAVDALGALCGHTLLDFGTVWRDLGKRLERLWMHGDGKKHGSVTLQTKALAAETQRGIDVVCASVCNAIGEAARAGQLSGEDRALLSAELMSVLWSVVLCFDAGRRYEWASLTRAAAADALCAFDGVSLGIEACIRESVVGNGTAAVAETDAATATAAESAPLMPPTPPSDFMSLLLSDADSEGGARLFSHAIALEVRSLPRSVLIGTSLGHVGGLPQSGVSSDALCRSAEAALKELSDSFSDSATPGIRLSAFAPSVLLASPLSTKKQLSSKWLTTMRSLLATAVASVDDWASLSVFVGGWTEFMRAVVASVVEGAKDEPPGTVLAQLDAVAVALVDAASSGGVSRINATAAVTGWACASSGVLKDTRFEANSECLCVSGGRDVSLTTTLELLLSLVDGSARTGSLLSRAVGTGARKAQAAEWGPRDSRGFVPSSCRCVAALCAGMVAAQLGEAEKVFVAEAIQALFAVAEKESTRDADVASHCIAGVGAVLSLSHLDYAFLGSFCEQLVSVGGLGVGRDGVSVTCAAWAAIGVVHGMTRGGHMRELEALAKQTCTACLDAESSGDAKRLSTLAIPAVILAEAAGMSRDSLGGLCEVLLSASASEGVSPPDADSVGSVSYALGRLAHWRDPALASSLSRQLQTALSTATTDGGSVVVVRCALLVGLCGASLVGGDARADTFMLSPDVRSSLAACIASVVRRISTPSTPNSLATTASWLICPAAAHATLSSNTPRESSTRSAGGKNKHGGNHLPADYAFLGAYSVLSCALSTVTAAIKADERSSGGAASTSAAARVLESLSSVERLPPVQLAGTLRSLFGDGRDRVIAAQCVSFAAKHVSTQPDALAFLNHLLGTCITPADGQTDVELHKWADHARRAVWRLGLPAAYTAVPERVAVPLLVRASAAALSFATNHSKEESNLPSFCEEMDAFIDGLWSLSPRSAEWGSDARREFFDAVGRCARLLFTLFPLSERDTSGNAGATVDDVVCKLTRMCASLPEAYSIDVLTAVAGEAVDVPVVQSLTMRCALAVTGAAVVAPADAISHVVKTFSFISDFEERNWDTVWRGALPVIGAAARAVVSLKHRHRILLDILSACAQCVARDSDTAAAILSASALVSLASVCASMWAGDVEVAAMLPCATLDGDSDDATADGDDDTGLRTPALSLPIASSASPLNSRSLGRLWIGPAFRSLFARAEWTPLAAQATERLVACVDSIASHRPTTDGKESKDVTSSLRATLIRGIVALHCARSASANGGGTSVDVLERTIDM